MIQNLNEITFEIESIKSYFYLKWENIQGDKSILIDIEQEREHDLIVYKSIFKIPYQFDFKFRSI